MKEAEVREELSTVLTNWLGSEIGRTSADRALVMSASQKLSWARPVFTQEETDAVIDCMMESIDIGSELSEGVIDYLNSKVV